MTGTMGGPCGRALVGNLLLLAAGLALLVIGADRLVDGAVEIAESLGVDRLVIGLTIVALGTSVPELATSVIAAIRGEREIAVGNIVGSNIMNILAIAGFTMIIAPDGVPVADAILRLRCHRASSDRSVQRRHALLRHPAHGDHLPDRHRA